MRNNHLFISILILMLPMVVWGQASSPTTLYIDKGAITIGSTSISGYDQNGNQIKDTNPNGYIITQTDASTPTSNTIKVDNSYSGTITLNNVNIIAPNDFEKAAFNAQSATNVTLHLKGNNTLESTNQSPALWAPEGKEKTLTIKADPDDPYGSLKATGAEHWPGIGVRRGSSLNITINSGYITAIGGSNNSGIGPSNGTEQSSEGRITINGGIVTAKDFIGGDNKTNTPNFTFSGGVIFTPSIKNKDDKESWKGLLFEDGQGKIYGDEITLNTDLTIPSGHTLTIENEQKLTLNNCTLTLEEGATIENNGGIIDAKTITYHSNYGDPEETRVQYTDKEVSVLTDLFTRQYHTFKGWYANAGNETGGAIEKVSETKDLYAHWTPNTFTLSTLTAPTLTYGTAMQDITLSSLLPADAVTNCGEITFTVSGLPAGLECNDGVISGTPTVVNTTGTTVTITATAENTSTTKQTLTFTVGKANPTLAFNTGPYEITYGESGVNIQTYSNSKGFITYAYYTNQECTEGKTSTQPTNAGSYWVEATITETTNYKGKSVTTTFVINKGTITVTPTSDQILYKGEAPEFDHSGEVNGETANFEGKLSVNTGNNNTIEQDNLQLKNNGSFLAANYELKMSSPAVTCTYYDSEPKDAKATITASTSNQPTEVEDVNWYDSDVTLTAPEGFTIRLTDNTNEAGETGEAESTTQLTFTEEGLHTVAYTLTRRGKDYPEKATFGIDLNAPTVSVQKNYLAFTLTATDGEGSGIASVKIDGMDVTLTDGEYKGNASAGTHTYLVTDKVGRKTEGSFTLTAYTPPPYVPSYYDIYLEPNDSVRLSTIGTTVEEGYSFTLTAEVAEGYDPATLVVEYRKGRSGSWQALKAESSGKYRIRSVYSDIYIRASVRPLGDPTALETVGDGKSHIRTGGGIVYIETPVPQRVTVFTLDGRLIRHESLPAGNSRLYGLPAGLYVIRLQDGTTVKGLVRR